MKTYAAKSTRAWPLSAMKLWGNHYTYRDYGPQTAVYVNKKRLQWPQDFPDGIKTSVQDGDVLSLGLIMDGGAV